jgi:hypothetical protein
MNILGLIGMLESNDMDSWILAIGICLNSNQKYEEIDKPITNIFPLWKYREQSVYALLKLKPNV